MKCLPLKHRTIRHTYRESLTSSQQKRLIYDVQESMRYTFLRIQPQSKGGGGYVLNGTKQVPIGCLRERDIDRVIAYIGKDYVKVYSPDKRPGLKSIQAQPLVKICKDVVNPKKQKKDGK